jgi:hypothetical protein
MIVALAVPDPQSLSLRESSLDLGFLSGSAQAKACMVFIGFPPPLEIPATSQASDSLNSMNGQRLLALASWCASLVILGGMLSVLREHGKASNHAHGVSLGVRASHGTRDESEHKVESETKPTGKVAEPH